MAGTVTVSSDKIQNVDGRSSVRTVILACVGDSVNGSIPDTTLNVAAGLSRPLTGWYPVRVKIKNAAADANVTDNSDVYLKDSDGIDFLGGQGVDQLDDSTTNYIRLNNYDPLHEDPILDVDNQSGASGAYTITFVFASGA